MSLFAPPGSYSFPPQGSIALLLALDCWGCKGRCLTTEACQTNHEMDLSESPQKPGKLIGYFEKAPGLSQTHANINITPGEQRSALFLSFSFSFSHTCALVTSTHPVLLHAVSPGSTRPCRSISYQILQQTGWAPKD